MARRRGDVKLMGTSYQRIAALDAAVHMRTFARKPVLFVRGEGMCLYDDDGREYLDFMSGIGVVNLGHSHPAVVDAIAQQAAKLTHVTNLYHVEHRADLAADLVGMFGAEARVFFANSGAEAIEGAIKLARKWATANKGPEARTIVTAWRSFHGRTLAALAATGQPSKQEAFEPLPGGFVHIDMNDIDALDAALDESVCALLLEPVQGEGGVYPCTYEYLQTARRLCDERGILLVFDEVQCGLYRAGHAFAHQAAGIRPDVMTLAKALANGLPAAAIVAVPAVADAFAPGDHGSTFGGGPVVCAAARATLRELAAMDAGARALEIGEHLSRGLAEIAENSSAIVEVRGAGAMVAAELARPVAAAVVDAALSRGLVLNNTSASTLRFLPPLVCTRADIDTLLEQVHTLLDKDVL